MNFLGYSFFEISTGNPEKLHEFLRKCGFKEEHLPQDLSLWHQGQARIIVNHQDQGSSKTYQQNHAVFSAPSIGIRVKNAKEAFETALKRGAKEAKDTSNLTPYALQIPAGNICYLIDPEYEATHFPINTHYGHGLHVIDHITLNVKQGEGLENLDFFKKVLGFNELYNYPIEYNEGVYQFMALVSPDGSIKLPINEVNDNQSTVSEFLELHQGNGFQHIAFQTNAIVPSIRAMSKSGCTFLRTPQSYYDLIQKRRPHLEKALKRFDLDFQVLQDLHLLTDGEAENDDAKGFLVQIFTTMDIPPLFFEIIQRLQNDGFEMENVKALSASLEEHRASKSNLFQNYAMMNRKGAEGCCFGSQNISS